MTTAHNAIERFSRYQRQLGDAEPAHCAVRDVLNLERDGLVTRHVFFTSPPSVEYRLAPLGQSLLEPMAALIDWADRHYPYIDAARVRFDGASGDVPR